MPNTGTNRIAVLVVKARGLYGRNAAGRGETLLPREVRDDELAMRCL
jgi:hypothetical protein